MAGRRGVLGGSDGDGEGVIHPPERRRCMAMKKAAFGGVKLSFKGRAETLEQVFGKAPIPPTELATRLWVFIRANPSIRMAGPPKAA